MLLAGVRMISSVTSSSFRLATNYMNEVRPAHVVAGGPTVQGNQFSRAIAFRLRPGVGVGIRQCTALKARFTPSGEVRHPLLGY
jgi:hypothetical protein